MRPVPICTAAATAALMVGILGLTAAPAEAAPYSHLWGRGGDRWDFNKLPDFSFAGYKFGSAQIPSPPATRSVLKFRKPGMSDSQMLLAAVAWANRQPLTNKYIVLTIPAGTFTLTDRLYIKRSRVVLRGAGAGKTTFYLPKSLTDRYGPNKDNPESGAYVTSDAFVWIQGRGKFGEQLATVNAFAAKGSYWLQVDKPGSFKAGDYYDTWWTDVNGRFNDYMFDNKWQAPRKYRGSTRVKFTTKVLAVRGNRIKIERRLPYNIQKGLNMVKIFTRPNTVTDCGVEGITFSFKWQLYAGHHLERGWHAIQLADVRDVWVRDIRTINADNSVTMVGVTSSTIASVRISSSKQRANKIPNRFRERADADGHWGVEFAHSFDLMIREITVDTIKPIMHSVGTDSSGKWSVFMNCRMTDGNLDLHRALAGPCLYTNIDVGLGTHALYSGGPKASGPNALAGTTWWNIKSKLAVDPNDSDGPPGACSFGPVINLVNVNLRPDEVRTMCKTWHYERTVNDPANLYEAQYALRLRAAAAANATIG